MTDSISRIALTGGTGFVGSNLLERLCSEELSVLNMGRSCGIGSVMEHAFFDLGDTSFDVQGSLREIDVLIHCAARAHVMDETLEKPLDAYLQFNTDSTLRLASQAAAAGVKRFIYLSSVKALGESTRIGKPFAYDSPLAPEDDYGVSKARAEDGLRDIAARTGMEVTIIRPPLVYGRGVKANFAAMMRLAGRNLPLPLASIRNKRSMVALDNLIDLISTCITHPLAGNQTFMVSDDADVSTPELLSAMTRAYDKKPRLLPCPPSILSLGASLLGKRAVAERLLGSLQVDIEHTKQVLGWAPRVKLDDVLKEMVRDSVI
ncbi:NAD dependent epimerase/dehydratase family protein [Pseudidiomarina maritima]|uniref:NAD dependent epimerase/dehydratase family protein n=1 Tax=Pseudidiomarina maritima TaxID=519453 RepID=A0A1I6GRV1_9GAMM|nr:SDR family oxidoreductase [Pseudidiomarina maritima]SFR44811.1 NAD dependent epimerase/dehydratase family protein [Pseudidiomarina maritima]